MSNSRRIKPGPSGPGPIDPMVEAEGVVRFEQTQLAEGAYAEFHAAGEALKALLLTRGVKMIGELFDEDGHGDPVANRTVNRWIAAEQRSRWLT